MSQCKAVLAGGLVATCMALTMPGSARAETASFDVYLLGLRAGTLSYVMDKRAERYAVTGEIRSAGVIGAIADFRMNATAKGRLNAAGFRPERYTEKSRENDTRSERVIRYGADGTPRLTSEEKPRDYWVPAARQAGTLDPMTMVYELLRDRDGKSPCALDATYGDGARMGRVSSTMQNAKGDEVTCSGSYERKGGFSRKELEDGTAFPFTLRYRRNGDTWELTQLKIDSVHGRAQLVRR
jgi:hypothetical protein